MNKKLTFLLALTFLFLFSGNSFGIDFGKSEEQKYKGTNIGVHLCNKINLDILSNSALKSDGKIKEFNFIKSRCVKKHEKKTGETESIDASESEYLYSEDFTCLMRNPHSKNCSREKFLSN